MDFPLIKICESAAKTLRIDLLCKTFKLQNMPLDFSGMVVNKNTNLML